MREKAISFESAIEELEGIVKKMEDGTISLDKSLELYERGVELAKLCSQKLDNAEQRVKILVKGESGGIEQVDFLTKNDD